MKDLAFVFALEVGFDSRDAFKAQANANQPARYAEATIKNKIKGNTKHKVLRGCGAQDDTFGSLLPISLTRQ